MPVFVFDVFDVFVPGPVLAFAVFAFWVPVGVQASGRSAQRAPRQTARICVTARRERDHDERLERIEHLQDVLSFPWRDRPFSLPRYTPFPTPSSRRRSPAASASGWGA
jgi:hypothetical protein